MTFVPPKAAFLPQPRIERITAEILLVAGLMPSLDDPVVDIEALLEDHLRVRLDQYAILPSNELGVTSFRAGKPPLVQINRDLTGLADDEDSPFWVKGRWRSTLAHEGAHVIFHREDYEGGQQPSLFDADEPVDVGPRLHRCLKRDFAILAKQTDPREYQANAGMAALLMPRCLFVPLARPLLQETGPDLSASRLESAVRILAEQFHVSRQAARIRLKTLDLGAMRGQQEIAL